MSFGLWCVAPPAVRTIVTLAACFCEARFTLLLCVFAAWTFHPNILAHNSTMLTTPGDKAYNDYRLEDMMKAANLNLLPLRKKNSHRVLPSGLTYLLSCCRKVIETTGSLIERLLPRHIHAVTARGFELKVALFVIAASCNAC